MSLPMSLLRAEEQAHNISCFGKQAFASDAVTRGSWNEDYEEKKCDSPGTEVVSAIGNQRK